MIVIGLGNTGCNIAEKFENIDGIDVICIDANIEGDNCISLKEQKTSEDYEINTPNILSNINLKYNSKEMYLII